MPEHFNFILLQSIFLGYSKKDLLLCSDFELELELRCVVDQPIHVDACFS